MSSIEQPRRASPVVDESAPRPLRASDAEREAVVAALHRALGEGRLTLAEADERVSAAYGARYRSDLPGLLDDLPPDQANELNAPSWAELWASLMWRARAWTWGAQYVAPTPRQQRAAGLVVGLAIAWLLACVVVAAALVGA